MLQSLYRWREGLRMARLLKRMHTSGLNVAQATTVIEHHNRRGQLPLLFAEWEV
jgi:hypothetical protein